MNEIKDVETLWIDVPEPTRQWAMRTRNRLTDEAHRERNGLGARPQRPKRGAVRVAAAGTLGAALAAGLVVSQAVDFTGGTSPAVARADIVLAKAAAAANGAAQQSGSGDYAYLKTKRVDTLPGGATSRSTEVQWLSVDDSQPGLIKTRRFGSAVPERLEERGMTQQEWQRRQGEWDSQQIPAGEQESDRLVPGPTYAYLRSLPEEPATLADMIDRAAASLPNSYDGGTLGVVGMILTDQVVPPETAGTMFRAAKRFDGIQVDKDVTLAASGEHGIAVTGTSDGTRTALVFDPETYDFLGMQRTEDGKVVTSSAIVREGLVDEIGQRPDAR